jgi:HK97 family phage portal protein
VDLTGECWIAIDRIGKVPYELWALRPDRVSVVTSRKDFLTGYLYHDPEGKEIPLRKENVLSIRMPHPKDPYRGLGPVQAVMPEVHGGTMSAEYNLNFFRNGAQPGGVVKVTTNLSDPQFNQLVERWEENHGGIHNAGRTAFLENGDYVPVKPITMADMQFVEGSNLRRDTILLAYGMSKFSVGIVDDVNRATAEASNAWFAEAQTVPRLDRWKGMLNNDFLPQFGEELSRGYSFVYRNPVPRDREADRMDKDSSVSNYVSLLGAGVSPEEAAAVCGLPPMTITAREGAQAQA